MQLEIQKYLRSGKNLTQLKEELGIEYKEYESLIILNYSQVDSPKTHPIVMECRGLILEKDSWDIVSFPFRRFFNFEEVPQVTDSFNFGVATAFEKLDGSLISVFNYKDKWYMSTRAVIENNSNVNLSSITFKELFLKAVSQYPKWSNLDASFAYVFELTALENRVVTVYEKPELHLLMMRRVDSWQELSVGELDYHSEKIGIDLPKCVKFDSREDLFATAKKLATLQEGYVAIDYTRFDDDGMSYKRVKVKNPAYVAIHHLKDSAGRSSRSLVSLVYDGEPDEFLGYFPEYRAIIQDVQEKYDAFLKSVEEDLEKVKPLLTSDRKTFALEAVKSKHSAYLFLYYNGKAKSIREFLAQIEKDKTRKYLEKFLVERLKLKEVEFIKE